MRYLLISLTVFLTACMTRQEDCSCEALSPEEAIAKADYAFTGECTYVNTNWISGGWKYSFRVDSTWKRGADQFLVVNSPWENNCGYMFEKGKKYLVYVSRKFSSRTNRCMGNKELDMAGADLVVLGPGDHTRTSSAVQMMYWTIGLLGFFSVLLVAAVVLRQRIWKPKS
ncbi:MAG: hypothetical protein EAZ89_18265 [Bacteroidetes bacterium]|nr:MAG: hypothetical protein EAZ89_18265 [Bacteroidota bacterium]